MGKDLQNYTSDSIKTMSSLEFYRTNASMMLGNLNLDANIQCLLEQLTNSEDEIIEDRPYLIKIILFKGKDRYQFAIVDHGRGVPTDNDTMTRVYESSFTSGKYATSSGYNAASGRNGLGVKLTVAVSNKYISYSTRREAFGVIRIDKGKRVDYQIMPSILDASMETGTTVFLEPDETILELTNQFWTSPEGYEKFLDIVHYHSSFKKNDFIEVHVIDHLLSEKFFKQSYVEQWKFFQNVQGKVVFRTPPDASPMKYINEKFNITTPPLWTLNLERQIDLADDDQNGAFSICLNRGKRSNGASLIGTVNFNVISGSTSSHIRVLMDVLKTKIKQYIPEDDSELIVYFDQKYNLPVYGVAQVIWKGASYAGQTKDNFWNKDFENLYYHELKVRCDKVPDEQWELLYELIKDEMYEDFARATNRSLNLSKSMKNLAASLNNDCFTPCRLKDPTVTELFITEGDSAGNWVKQARDPAFQAVLKLRGKPLNAFDADQAKIKANAVLQDMFRIIGVSPRDTDLSNMNFAKIGILADADPDGYHIVCLTLGNLYKINPLILQQGRVFIANPPLYEMETHDSSLYLRDAKALNDVRVKIYANYLDIYLQVYNQRELESVKAGMIPKVNREPKRLTNESYRDFVYVVNRIGTIITELSNRLAIEPILLEQLIHCVDDMVITNLNTDAIRDKLQITDCVYNELANTLLLIDRDVETTVQLSRLVSEIRGYILPLLEEIHWRNFDVLISTKLTPTYNKTPQTFYQIYQIFKTIDSKFNMHIHKGLGSTPVDILKVSCCDPKTRSSSIITNIGDVTEFYRMLGSDPAARKQLIRKDLKELQVPDEFIDQI